MQEPLIRLDPILKTERWVGQGHEIDKRLEALGVKPGDPFDVVAAKPLATEAHTRRTDPATSRAAAAALEDLRRSQREVLETLAQAGPMTDVALVSEMRMRGGQKKVERQSDSGIRSRRKELADALLVRDTGRKAKLPSGRMGTVWEAVPQIRHTLSPGSQSGLF